MAGIPLMPQQHADGVSLLPLLKDRQIPERSFFFHYPHYGNQGGEPSSIVQQGEWKLIRYYEDGREELYNLRIDSAESETLNAQHPQKVKELSANLTAWLQEAGAKYPVPDIDYNPLKEEQFKQQVKEKLLLQLEKTRKYQLCKNFTPKKDWWGSTIND